MKKIYLLLPLVIIALVIMFICSIPSKLNNKDYNKNIEDVIEIFDESKYITRRDFFKAVSKIVGGDESTFEFYSHFYPENLYILDVNVYDIEQMTLISMCYRLGALQTHLKFSLKDEKFCHCFDIDKHITMQEAVVVLQCVLQDISVNEVPISSYSRKFRQLYKQAKLSGILKKEDLIYTLPIDCKITKNDCKILFSRFLNINQIKYFDGSDLKRNDGSITYIEYFKSKNGVKFRI